MYLLDTNIFLEILLEQKKMPECLELIGSLNLDQEGWVTSFAIHSIEAILDGRNRRDLIESFLLFLITHPHLHHYVTTLEEEHEISKSLSKGGLDFDDSLQYYVAKKKDLTLVTLDKDFKGQCVNLS